MKVHECDSLVFWREQIQRPVFVLSAPAGLNAVDLPFDPIAQGTLHSERQLNVFIASINQSDDNDVCLR